MGLIIEQLCPGLGEQLKSTYLSRITTTTKIWTGMGKKHPRFLRWRQPTRTRTGKKVLKAEKDERRKSELKLVHCATFDQELNWMVHNSNNYNNSSNNNSSNNNNRSNSTTNNNSSNNIRRRRCSWMLESTQLRARLEKTFSFHEGLSTPPPSSPAPWTWVVKKATVRL